MHELTRTKGNRKMLIKTRYKIGDTINSGGKCGVIASFLTEQTAIHEKKTGKSGRTIKGKRIGYEKPEITIYRLHCGKILKSSNKYVGLDYI